MYGLHVARIIHNLVPSKFIEKDLHNRNKFDPYVLYIFHLLFILLMYAKWCERATCNSDVHYNQYNTFN